MKISSNLLLALLLGISAANATLVKTDFLNPNDGLIVKDTATNFEWLTPLYTKGHPRDSAFVQTIISNYGFRYATATETSNLLTNNFGTVTTNFPGDAAGYTAATNFFNLFGIGISVTPSSGVPWQLTLGLSGTLYPGYTDWYQAFGFFRSNDGKGFAYRPIQDPGNNGINTNGSYLVRSASEGAVPEPSALSLFAAGLLLIASQSKLRHHFKRR